MSSFIYPILLVLVLKLHNPIKKTFISHQNYLLLTIPIQFLFTFSSIHIHTPILLSCPPHSSFYHFHPSSDLPLPFSILLTSMHFLYLVFLLHKQTHHPILIIFFFPTIFSTILMKFSSPQKQEFSTVPFFFFIYHRTTFPNGC